MEQYLIYLWIIWFVGLHLYAFMFAGEPDPDVEQMWNDNF